MAKCKTWPVIITRKSYTVPEHKIALWKCLNKKRKKKGKKKTNWSEYIKDSKRKFNLAVGHHPEHGIKKGVKSKPINIKLDNL